jgi:hypothetical protein
MASFLSDLFSGGAEKEAAQKDIAAAQGYQGQALPALAQGYQTGTTALNQGIGAFAPLAGLGAQYSSVAPLLTNALGAGGAAGQQSALNAFQNYNPGYQFALNQAQQAAERAAGAGGMTASGNLIQAEQQNASNLANQNFNNWISQLQGTGQMGIGATQAAAQGQAAGYGGLADLAQNYAQNQTGVYGNVASAMMNANQLQAQGEAQGAKNLLGAGMSLATLGLGGNPFGGSLMGGSSTGSAGGTGGYSLGNTPIGQAWSGLKGLFS